MNPYEELGIKKDASTEEVKKAYRRRSKKTHPDTGGTAEAFERVQQSYLVLSDPEQREQYDRTGEFKSKGIENDPAIHILGGIFMGVLDNDIPEYVNLLDIVVKALKVKIAEMQSEIDKLEGMNGKIKKARTKLKYKKKGVGIMQQMLDYKVVENNRLIAKIKRVQLNHERAHTIAKDYDYAPEKPPVATYETLFGKGNGSPNPFIFKWDV